MNGWKMLGQCREIDLEVFFPENDRWAEKRAKDICAGCLVRAQCMDYALAHNEVGIWGGTTQRERNKIKNRYVRSLKGLAAQPVSL